MPFPLKKMLTGVNCVLNFETVIFYISFIYDFFFLWRVQCIFRVVRQINKHGFTWTASKGLHGLTCKLIWTASNDKHIQKLDTLIAAERSKILRRHGLTWPHTIHSIKLLSIQELCLLCVCREILHINELKTLVPAYKPHPKFWTFFSLKKVRPIRG